MHVVNLRCANVVLCASIPAAFLLSQDSPLHNGWPAISAAPPLCQGRALREHPTGNSVSPVQPNSHNCARDLKRVYELRCQKPSTFSFFLNKNQCTQAKLAFRSLNLTWWGMNSDKYLTKLQKLLHDPLEEKRHIGLDLAFKKWHMPQIEYLVFTCFQLNKQFDTF